MSTTFTTSTTSSTHLVSVRRTVAAVVAACAIATTAACGGEVAPPRNDVGGAGPREPLPTFTMQDCLDPGKQPPVTTCPYPIRSGDDVAGTRHRMQYDDEYARPGR